MSFIAATARCTILLCSVLVASCARPGTPNDSQAQFGIITSEGRVLANVEGSATGFTNTELTHLIRTGVSEVYAIDSDVSSDAATAGRRMFWHVINDGRKPTAVISVHLVQDGKIARSAYADAAAPDSDSDEEFMYVVSHLAREVLPPAAQTLVSSQHRSS